MSYLKKLIPYTLSFMVLSTTVSANAAETGSTYVYQHPQNQDQANLAKWQAGTKVQPASITTFGIDRCFNIEKIGQSLFKRIYKKSYKADCNIPLDSLRYLKVLHYNAQKEICLGELICHYSISKDLISIFKELFNAKYPIERMVLIDNYNADDETSMQANNTSCFNFRKVAGTKSLSKHSLGKAIDINTKYNPCVKRRNGKTICQPVTGRAYIDRSKDFPYKIDENDLCYKLFTQHGFTWGGHWRSLKDYQHFEK